MTPEVRFFALLVGWLAVAFGLLFLVYLAVVMWRPR